LKGEIKRAKVLPNLPKTVRDPERTWAQTRDDEGTTAGRWGAIGGGLS